MNWDTFIYYAVIAGVCWLAGAGCAFRKRSGWALGWSAVGSLVFLVFLIGFWMELERPPLRTMGETRLWYSFFLSVVGIGLYAKCRYHWMLGFSTLMAWVFVLVNLLKPEIHSKTLMPALQSVWCRSYLERHTPLFLPLPHRDRGERSDFLVPFPSGRSRS